MLSAQPSLPNQIVMALEHQSCDDNAFYFSVSLEAFLVGFYELRDLGIFELSDADEGEAIHAAFLRTVLMLLFYPSGISGNTLKERVGKGGDGD